MKKIWLLMLVFTIVGSAALVTHRVIWAGNRPSSPAHEKADVTSGGAPSAIEGTPAVGSQTVEISQRGPGMRRQPPDAVKLAVPRNLDLTHVTAANFAAALRDDPIRIFNYLRDEIAYEAYKGCLRGSRGTLLAMAGNSVDRASLLASMLQHAGQRVRFAHGTLPEPLARDLVTSMWAERPQPASPNDNASAEAKAMSEKLVASVKRDYTLIRDQLKQAHLATSPQLAPSLDSLIKEAQDHYWIQWSKNGNWVDLDPSFVDSAPGTKYITVADTFDTLADGLFHRVEIRVRAEEYTGDQVSNRVILSRKIKAADLSGVDVILAHQPENWTGPVTNLQSALASGITATGRIKPVLIVGGEDWAAGQPFYTKTPPSSGMGGVFNALAGIGTRNQAPIATAGWIEVEFISPAGNRNIVTREIFDLVGEGRRYKGTKLTAEELRSKSSAEAATDITTNIYSLFFTTGRIATNHLYKLAAEPNSDETFGVDRFLRRISILFAASSDALLKRIGRPERAVIVFYPDSPRVEIADLSSTARTRRFSLDLRRTDIRAVALGPHPESVFSAQVLRGVVEGTLERSLTEYVMGNATKPPELAISTSLIFERARAKGIGAILLLPRRSTVIGPMSDDTGARVREDLANGFMVVAPEQQILLTQTPRFAWWRIEPGSGKTTALTDEGLHQTGTEFTFNENTATHRVTIGERALINGRWITETARETVGPKAALAFVKACLEEGAELSQILEGWTV